MLSVIYMFNRSRSSQTSSDHFYIEFDTCFGTPSSNQKKQGRKIDLKQFETALVKYMFDTVTNCNDADQCVKALTEVIHECCSPPSLNDHRKSVHWWTPEIGFLRKTSNHLRRIFQRKRKRHGTEASTTEAIAAKVAKMALV